MNSQKRLVLTFVLLLALLAACGGEDATTPGADTAETAPVEEGDFFTPDPATAARLTGKVVFEGEPPASLMQPINMSGEPECKTMHDEPPRPEVVVVNENGTLKNVLVWIKSGLEGKRFRTPGEPVLLDQIGCVYKPHVIALQTNQLLSVANSDPTTHNVHPLPRANNEWNRSQTAGAPNLEARFDTPELMILVKCNIHPWMRSYINVMDHPYFAITGGEGTFEIANLPPGEYTVEAMHERYKGQEISVALGEGESKEIAFTYTAN